MSDIDHPSMTPITRWDMTALTALMVVIGGPWGIFPIAAFAMIYFSWINK